MHTFSHFSNVDQLKAAAAEIEEFTDGSGVTYIGIPEKETESTADPKWSIIKITETITTGSKLNTSILWANGQCGFNCKWDDRASLTYTYPKF